MKNIWRIVVAVLCAALLFGCVVSCDNPALVAKARAALSADQKAIVSTVRAMTQGEVDVVLVPGVDVRGAEARSIASAILGGVPEATSVRVYDSTEDEGEGYTRQEIEKTRRGSSLP